MDYKMEKIIQNGKLVALKISSIEMGTSPIVSPEEPLQVLTLKYPKDKQILPHYHIPKLRETRTLQECLIVIDGKILISFFTEDKEKFAHLTVSKGEACIILSGANSVQFLEDSEVIEVKNGPYIEDRKNL
jgi:hypothetical protein